MAHYTNLIIAVLLAIGARTDDAHLSPRARQLDNDCNRVLTVSHVPGHMDKVWTLGCE